MSSLDLKGYIVAFQAAEDADKSPVPSHLAALIEKGETSLHQLVKALGPDVLVSDEADVRGRGIRLLGLVVSKLPAGLVTRLEVRTLTDFFCAESTLEKETVLDATQGLTALAACANFGTGDTMQTCRALFSNVQMRELPQSTRFRVYTLFDYFMAHHRRALKRMGEEFLTGYCNLASGEKDPRNLTLAFGMDRVILIEFDISNKVEDFFDITFCYFPITFTPPPGDPYGITGEELQADLRKTLVSTPRFGPLAVPLILDKLQASSPSAKRQSLMAYTEGFPIYGRAVCWEFSKRLWEALMLEVYHATTPEFETLSFAALQTLLSVLYPDDTQPAATEQVLAINGSSDGHMHGDEQVPADDDTPVEGIAIDICDHCLSELQEVDKSNAKSAAKVLASMITVSARLADYVLPRVIEDMLKRYRDPEQGSHKPAILAVIGTVLAATRSRPPPYPAVLAPFGDEVLSVLVSALKPASTRAQALAAVVQLAQIPKFLAEPELVYVIQNLVSLVSGVDVEHASESEDDVLEGVAAIAEHHPKTVEQYALPPLVSQLPEAGSFDSESAEDLRATLSSLAIVCLQPDLFEALSVRLLSRLERAASIAAPTSADRLFAHLMLATLRLVLEKKVARKDSDIPKYLNSLVPNLFRIFLSPAFKQMDEDALASDLRLLCDAGLVALLIVQSLDAKQQAIFANALWEAYQKGDLQTLLGTQPHLEAPFVPLEVGAPLHQASTCILFSACMVGMSPELYATRQDLVPFVQNSLQATVNWQSEPLFLAGARLLAMTVNKRSPDLSAFLDDTLPAFWSDKVVSNSILLEERVRALRTVAWIARGLIVRGDHRGYDWLKHIMELFAHEALGHYAARALAIISDDRDDLLSKRNHAVVRMLYRQRLFTSILSQILMRHKTREQTEQSAFVIALAVLIRHIPPPVAKADLPKLMPLLLRALELPDADLRIDVMDTLTASAVSLSEALTPHASSLISLLLRNSAIGPISARLSALRCLGTFPLALPYISLHAQKPVVLRELARSLDDKRKSVRKEAVDARSRWFSLAAAAAAP